MSKYRYQREFLFAQRKVDEVSRFLKDKPNTDLSQVVDDKNNTVLHQCSYQGSLIVMKEYVNFMRIYWKNNNNSKETYSFQADVKYRIERWVNQKNKEGFTCLHYAAFKGQIQILRYLDELGADIHIKTNSGLGMLHLASQGDKVKTFVYYRDRLDINQPDERKSTPLHWAAFSGSQIVSQYLLSQQNIGLDLQDVQQQTPLHLATIQGNTKIIRKLLIAGANRHIKNDKGEQPIIIAEANDFINTQQLLNDDYKCLDHVKFFFNLKIKYEPKKRSFKIPKFFIFLSIILIGSISYSLKYHQDYQVLFYVQQGIFGFILLLYLSLVLPSPQKRKGSYQGLKNLWLSKKQGQSNYSSATDILSSSNTLTYFNKDLSSICIRCVQYKPARSNHCDVCKTCIQQYDHHCPWINNCVGRHNIIRFNLFLILLAITLLWIIAIGIQFVLVLAHDQEDGFAFFQINPQLHDNLPFLFGFVFIAFTLGLIFFVPLLLLIIVNIGNLFIGKTTFERFAKTNRSSVLSRSQREFMGQRSENKGKRGKVSCTNCAEMCIVKNENDSERNLLL